MNQYSVVRGLGAISDREMVEVLVDSLYDTPSVGHATR